MKLQEKLKVFLTKVELIRLIYIFIGILIMGLFEVVGVSSVVPFIAVVTSPELIHEKWDNLVDLVIDGGYGDNQASTVIDLSQDEPLIVREGKGSLEIF